MVEACGKSYVHSEEWLILPGRGTMVEDFAKEFHLKGKDSAMGPFLIPGRGSREFTAAGV